MGTEVPIFKFIPASLGFLLLAAARYTKTGKAKAEER
jgi:hypothetical protein